MRKLIIATIALTAGASTVVWAVEGTESVSVEEKKREKISNAAEEASKNPSKNERTASNPSNLDELATLLRTLRAAEGALGTDDVACSAYLAESIGLLERLAPTYDERSKDGKFVRGAIGDLRNVKERLDESIAKGETIDAESADAKEKRAQILRIVDRVKYLYYDVLTKESPPGYDGLRWEVEMNVRAGEGDIKQQIQTRLDAAARLNEEAEALEAENKALEAKVMKVQRVHDFWKELIGEDNAYLAKCGEAAGPGPGEGAWNYPPPTPEIIEVEPTAGDYNNAINAGLDDMKKDVKGEFETPAEMKIYETKTVRFTAEFAEDKKIEPGIEFIDTAEGKRRLEIFQIKTTPAIVAQLLPVDNNFEIEPEEETEQYLERGGSCPWEWSITAKKRGPQKLKLKVGYRVYDPRGTQRTVYKPALHKEVTVKVGDNWLEYFWREYWKVITAVLAAISLVLGIILSLKKLLKRKEKDKDAD